MNGKTVQSEGVSEAYLRLPVPLGDPDGFRHRATADVLHVLVDNPDRTFTNRALYRGNKASASGLDPEGEADI